MHAVMKSYAMGKGGVFTSVFSATLGAGGAGGGTTICDVISGPFSKNGSKVRLTLQAQPASSFVCTEMWMGHAAVAGNPYDFDGTQVQLTAAGSTSLTAPLGGSLVTDAINYNFNATKNFIIAYFGSTGNAGRNSSVPNANLYFLAGSDTSSVTAKAAGYGLGATTVDLISMIEVFG